MSVKELGMVWIAVKDFKKAVEYYTKVVGLEVLEMHEQMGWAELGGSEGGIRLGIGQCDPKSPVQPGANAIPTFTVDALEKSTKEMKAKGAVCVGAVDEVPGHVKMQLMRDPDGNLFHVVQVLNSACSC